MQQLKILSRGTGLLMLFLLEIRISCPALGGAIGRTQPEPGALDTRKPDHAISRSL